MGLENYLLDKQDIQKYNLFKLLKSMDYETTTVKDLSRQLGTPYSATYTTFNRVVEDIRELDDTYEPQNLAEKRLSSDNIKVTVNEYRLYLLQNSLAFQFFDAVALTPGSGVSAFLQKHFISEATLVRRVHNFRRFIARYGISISFKKFEFQGDEMKIRQLLFVVYAMSYHDFIPENAVVNYQRTQTLYQELNDTYGWLNTKSDGVRWLAISLLRMSQKKFIGDSNRADFFFNENHIFNAGIFNQKNFPTLPKDILVNEAKYYYVMTYFFGEYEVSGDEFNSQFYNFMEAEENYIWQFKELFLTYMETVNFAGTRAIKNNPKAELNLIKLLSTYYLQGGNYPKRSDFMLEEDNRFAKLQLNTEVSDFLNHTGNTSEYLRFVEQCDDLVLDLTILLSPYYKALEKQQLLNVAVMVDESNYVSGTLTNLLADLSFVNLVEDESAEKADVIVSTLAMNGLLSQLMSNNNADKVRTAANRDAKQPAMLNWQANGDIMDFHSIQTKLKSYYRAKAANQKVG